jgi:hypothetical protein
MLVQLQLNTTEIGLNKPCMNNTGAMALLKPDITLLVKKCIPFYGTLRCDSQESLIYKSTVS